MMLFAGAMSCATAGNNAAGGLLVILGIICLAATAGIRYWLGHIIRMR